MTPHTHRSVSKRLGLRPGSRVWVGGHNLAAKRAIVPFLVEAARPPTGPLDAVFIASDTPEEADYFLHKLARRLPTDGTAWIITRTNAQATEDQHTRDQTVTLDSDYAARAVHRC